jgi:hypothetical protein
MRKSTQVEEVKADAAYREQRHNQQQSQNQSFVDVPPPFQPGEKPRTIRIHNAIEDREIMKITTLPVATQKRLFNDW